MSSTYVTYMVFHVNFVNNVNIVNSFMISWSGKALDLAALAARTYHTARVRQDPSLTLLTPRSCAQFMLYML